MQKFQAAVHEGDKICTLVSNIVSTSVIGSFHCKLKYASVHTHWAQRTRQHGVLDDTTEPHGLNMELAVCQHSGA